MSKVSIIVPVYNSEKYLDKCILSLLNQTYEDIEIILIDDKSNDKSINILEQYQEMFKDKIKVLKNEKNSGAAASRNKGLDIATGEYVIFIDSDDYLDLDAIEKMVKQLEKTDSDIARINRTMVFKGVNVSFLGRKVKFDEESVIRPKEQLSYLTEEWPAVTNKLFKRELIANRRFPEDLKWEDYPFCVPLLYKANKVAVVTGPNYRYTVNPNGTTVTDTKKITDKMLDIFTCSDLIKDELLTMPNLALEQRLNFLAIQNTLQRTRDILYSNIPLAEKKRLISLVSALINKKYGFWKDNELYKEYRNSRKLYSARMKIVENMIDEDMNDLSEEEIVNQLTKK